MDIECDFERKESNQRFYVSCAKAAAASMMQSGKWPQRNVKIVFTDKIARANVPPSPDEVVFFMSEIRAQKGQVHEPRTIIPHDGLDHLPRNISVALESRFKAVTV